MIGYTVTISKKNACYYQNFVPRTSLEDRRNEFIKFHPKKKLVSLLLRFQVSTVNSEIVCRTLDKNTRRGVRGRVAREQPESAITIQIAAIFRISFKAQMVDCSFVPAFVFFFFFFFSTATGIIASILYPGRRETRRVLSRLRLPTSTIPRVAHSRGMECSKLGNVTGTRFEPIRNAAQQASNVRPARSSLVLRAGKEKGNLCWIDSTYADTVKFRGIHVTGLHARAEIVKHFFHDKSRDLSIGNEFESIVFHA